MEKITEQQLKYIQELQDMSLYPLPAFLGDTYKEAKEYINKYENIAHETLWAISLI